MKTCKMLILLVILLTPLYLLSQSVAKVSESGHGYISGDMVNIRAEADAKSESLGYLLKGTDVSFTFRTSQKQTVAGKSAYWYKCSFGDYDTEPESGWVFGSFITITKESGRYDDFSEYFAKYDIKDFPAGFRKLSAYSWSDMTKQDLAEGGERGGGPEIITIDRNILTNNSQYMYVPVYLIRKVTETKKNIFELELYLIAESSPIKNAAARVSRCVIVYDDKNDTITVSGNQFIPRFTLYRYKKV